MLENLTPPTKNRSCKVRTVLNQLDDKDKEILVAAIADENLWPAKTLCNALQGRGISLLDVSISRHRNGICSCSKI